MKFFLLLFLLFPMTAWGLYTDRILYLVNNTPISNIDIIYEKNFLLFITNKKITAYNLQNTQKQAINNLIMTILKEQIIKKNHISVSEEQIKSRIQTIAQENRISTQSFMQRLHVYKIPFSFLKRQLSAQIGWQTLIVQKYMPQIHIPDSAINEIYQQQKISNYTIQKKVIDLFLPAFNTKQKKQALIKIQSLINRVKNGENFQSLAKKYSQSPYKNGNLGWVAHSTLEPMLYDRIQKLPTGHLSSPIETDTGIHLFQVIEQKKVSKNQTLYSLYETVIPLKYKKLTTKIKYSMKSCTDASFVSKAFPFVKIHFLQKIPDQQITRSFQEILSSMQKNQTSEPILTNNGVVLLTLCSTASQAVSTMSKQEIMQLLIQEQLKKYESQLLLSLRKQAYIESIHAS